jgi:hypothetical protein
MRSEDEFMAPAKWASIIGQRMALLSGVSQPTICSLTGVNLNRLGQFLTGAKDLDNETVLKIYNTLLQLERIQHLMEPVPVDFRNIRAIKELLERIRLDGFESIMPVFKPEAAESQSATTLH